MYMLNSVIIVGKVKEILCCDEGQYSINFTIETETRGNKFTFEIRCSGMLVPRLIKFIKKNKLVRIVGRLESDLLTGTTYVFAECFEKEGK